MFTGIIESLCKVVSFNGGKLIIDLRQLASEVKLGDSVAVNGLCLTASKIERSNITFDVSPESIARSKISKLKLNDTVNIELAMKADGRFGGHIVQGHVDGTATIKSIQQDSSFSTITFAADKNLLDQMVEKGSVAIDGISLTIAKLQQNSFSVAVIPVTLRETTLGNAKTGDMVNIETDIVGKVIKKHITNILGDKSGGLTIDKLKEYGF